MFQCSNTSHWKGQSGSCCRIFQPFFIKNVKEAPRGSSGKNNNLDRALVSPQRRIGRQRALVDDSFSASIFTLLRILAQHTPPRRQNSYFIKHARRHLIWIRKPPLSRFLFQRLDTFTMPKMAPRRLYLLLARVYSQTRLCCFGNFTCAWDEN
jgi:hypothetical protein